MSALCVLVFVNAAAEPIYTTSAPLFAQVRPVRPTKHAAHAIALHSVLEYPNATVPNGLLETSAAVAVGVNGDFATNLGHLRTSGSWGDDAWEAHHATTPASSYIQTHSIVHASQLERLRLHQKERQAHRMTRAEAEAAAEAKHRAEMNARRSFSVDVNGIIPLTNLRDSQYVGPIGVGTLGDGKPESIINVVFDTGSTNLWIATTLCKSNDCEARHQYDAPKSTTYATPAQPVHLDITFGTGELRGPQGIDYFHVGPYTVKNQTFGMIQDEVGEVFQEIPFEGILGMAFPSMSARHVTPFFDNVMQQDVLHGHNEISFYMTKMPDRTSAVFFGGVDDRFYKGDIIYFPVTQEHYWSIDIIDFKVGDVSHVDFLEYKSTGPRVSKLILDTGTTYFTAPPGLYTKVTDMLPSTDCSKVDKYPSLHYVLKDVDGQIHDITVPPQVYMVSTYGDGWCDLSFMEIPVPDEFGPAFIFGEVFMREWYTVYSRGKGTPGSAMVGFALAQAPPTEVTDKIRNQNAVTEMMGGGDPGVKAVEDRPSADSSIS
jgi:pepsin A